MRLVFAAALSLFLAWCPARAGAAQGAETPAVPAIVFEFHSGFWVNLHHFLYLQGRLRQEPVNLLTPDEYATAVSTKGMTAEQVRAWESAVQTYADSWSTRDLALTNQMVLIDDRLAELDDCPDLAGKSRAACTSGILPELVTALDEAAPIYRQRWWPDQDRANRAWIDAMKPLVDEIGTDLARQLADIYQSRWPSRIRVDAVFYAGPQGAYASLEPVHLVLASQDRRNQGVNGLAMLFFQASHALAGDLEEAIARECHRLEKPIPRDLWDALLSYTTVMALNRTVESLQTRGKVPAIRALSVDGRNGIYDWQNYELLIDAYWKPHLDGNVDQDRTVLRMVNAMYGE